MGWDFYCRGYGPWKVGEFRSEIRAKIVGEVLAEGTTSEHFYFAIRAKASEHAASIWDVEVGADYVTCLVVPYKRPAGDNGFGYGNAYDESQGPNGDEPPRKIWDLLTPLRALTQAEHVYNETVPRPLDTPEDVNTSKVWAHAWRGRVEAMFAGKENARAIRPGVIFRTAEVLQWDWFKADTFQATELIRNGRSKTVYVPVDHPSTTVRLRPEHLRSATILPHYGA